MEYLASHDLGVPGDFLFRRARQQTQFHRRFVPHCCSTSAQDTPLDLPVRTLPRRRWALFIRFLRSSESRCIRHLRSGIPILPRAV